MGFPDISGGCYAMLSKRVRAGLSSLLLVCRIISRVPLLMLIRRRYRDQRRSHIRHHSLAVRPQNGLLHDGMVA